MYTYIYIYRERERYIYTSKGLGIRKLGSSASGLPGGFPMDLGSPTLTIESLTESKP